MRTRNITLIALLLAGCGGGGSDTAVSANPPAAEPPAAATPSPAPIVAPPPKAPAPIPSPVSPPPPPPAATPPGASPPPAPSITGAILRSALSTWIDASGGRPGPAWVTNADGSYAMVTQRSVTTPVDPGSYGTQSGVWNPDLAYASLSTSFIWLDANDARELGTTMEASGGVMLYRDAPFRIGSGESYTLNQTIAEWRPQSAADPWFAQLQVQTDARSNTVFRACWHVRLPQVIRLWCGLFDRVTAEPRGVVIMDDSNGLGAKTWQTQ